MVLRPKDFRLHRSLRQAFKRRQLHNGFSMSFDRDFHQVIERCSQAPREGQNGTWIVPNMIDAYLYHGTKPEFFSTHMVSCAAYKTGNEELCNCKDWQEGEM
jgi:Leu/Phe-tRNA-protein transferase